MTCARCGASLPPGAKFCGQCGTAVAPLPPPTAAVDADAPAPIDVPGPPAPVDAAGAGRGGDGGVDTIEVGATPSPTRSRGWLFALCGLLAIGVVGVVAWMLLRSDDVAAGGASSPEAVATGFAEAMSNEDLLAASAFVSPTEMPGLDGLLVIVRDAAKAQGISGLSSGEGLDVQLDLEASRVTELADGVARVELSMSMSMEGAPSGPLGTAIGTGVRVDDRDVTEGLANVLGMNRRPDLYVIVVEESGKWFVSPMLTAGDYLADALDLPSPDYRAIEEADDSARTADTEEAAFDQLADAINDRDPALAVGVLAPGEARFVRVFDRALEDLLDRDSERDLSIDGVQVEETATDRWALTGFEIVATDEYGDESTWQFDDSCYEVTDAYGDRSTGCLADLVPLTEPLDSEQLIVHTTHVDGAVQLQLAASLIDEAGQLASRLSRATVLDGLGLEMFDTPVPANADEPITLTFDGEAYQVIELTVAEDRPYLLQLIDNEAEVGLDFYSEATGWDWHDWAWQDRHVISPVAEGGRLRAVVRPGNDCDDDQCEPRHGSVTIRFQRLQTIEADVNTVVKPKLGAGTSILMTVPTDEEHRYEFSTDTDGVEIALLDYGWVEELPVDDDGYITPTFGGTTTILVTNTGDAEVTAEVTIREHELAEGGSGDPTGEGVTIDLTDSGATYVFEHEPGVSGTVTVVPDGLQDIVLDIAGCDSCLTDAGYSGDSESTFVTFGDETETEIYVTPYSGVDGFGSVTIYVELD